MPRNKQINEHLRADENGFASIVIALVLIVVLALVVTGFAQLSRREQKSALDKQLANQAYYAAESGINDVAKALPAIAASSTPPDKTKCLTDTQMSSYGLSPSVNPALGISYSCVLVDARPPILLYNNVAASSQRYTSFISDPSPLTSLTISWGSTDGHISYNSSTRGFRPLSGSVLKWGTTPAVLQISITPVPNGALSRSALTGRMFTTYLYPSTALGSVTYDASAGKQGQIVSGACSGRGAYPCSVTISGLNVPNTQAYILSIVDYYDSSNITVTGRSGVGAVNFVGAQAQVDVTGKAQDVLKRLRVNIPVHASYKLAPNIEAQDICKRFTTAPVTAENPGGTQFDTALSSVCKLD